MSLSVWGPSTASAYFSTSGLPSKPRRMDFMRNASAANPAFGQSGDSVDIDWERLRTEGGSSEEGQRYLPKLLQVMEHAQKAQRFFPNLSHRHYGATVVMNNGVRAMGTNVESSRQDSLCDLRFATANAVNQSIALQPARMLGTLPTPLKVKTAFLVNANLKGDRPVPCADCQKWMAGEFYTPETKVISLEWSPRDHRPVVRIRTVADMLPLHMGRREPVRMMTERDLKKLPLQISEKAKTIQSPLGQDLTSRQMLKMLEQARSAYLQNEVGSKPSGLRTGVCVKLASSNQLFSQGRFDWSTRWFEGADLRAAATRVEIGSRRQKAVQQLANSRWCPGFAKDWLLAKLKKPEIQAVAYFGNDPIQPDIPALGRIARSRGSSDTVILTVENDVIQCRTIADFMPEMYRTRQNKA